MTGAATVESAPSRPGAALVPIRVLLGVAAALVAWWGTYVAYQAYLTEAFSFARKLEWILVVAPAVLFLVSVGVAALLLRWRSAAIGASATALLGLALGAYATVTGDGSFLVVDPDTVPGRGLLSGNPLLGVVNDLGSAVIASIVHSTLLLVSATWLALAMSDRYRWTRGGPQGLVNRWHGVVDVLAGAAMVPIVIWLLAVAGETMLARSVNGGLSPVEPAVVMLIGSLSTYLLIRSPRAALGAGATVAIVLVISIASGKGIPTGLSSPTAWRFSTGTFVPALLGAARTPGVLVLFGAWTAIVASAARIAMRRFGQRSVGQAVATSS